MRRVKHTYVGTDRGRSSGVRVRGKAEQSCKWFLPVTAARKTNGK